MASIVSSVNNTLATSLLTNTSATRKVVNEVNKTPEAQVVNSSSVAPTIRSSAESAKVFSPDDFSPTSANKALGQYLSIQNNERREQVSQLFGLDIYA